MKKYVKVIIVVHVLMVCALLSTGLWAVVIGTVEVSSVAVVTEILAAEGVAIGTAAIGGATALGIDAGTNEAYTLMGVANATVLGGMMVIPVIGPVMAALEYFDVTDFVDWF